MKLTKFVVVSSLKKVKQLLQAWTNLQWNFSALALHAATTETSVPKKGGFTFPTGWYSLHAVKYFEFSVNIFSSNQTSVYICYTITLDGTK